MVVSAEANLPGLLRGWREDTMHFLRRGMPKIVLVLLVAYILTRILRSIARKTADLQAGKLPGGLRVQQVRTVTSVLTGIGVAVILFVAALEVLPVLGLDFAPMLASAGVAGIAIAFGAQTLVRDFINGFFILFENQYDLGDTVRIAGVKGVVERMSLRATVLRDEDGTLHMVPNSLVQIVSKVGAGNAGGLRGAQR